MNEGMNEILYFTLVKNYTVKKPGKQKRHVIKGPAYINQWYIYQSTHTHTTVDTDSTLI